MENKTLNTVLTGGSFLIGIVGLILGIMVMTGNEGVVGISITLAMVLMGIGAGVAILFGLFQLFSNIKKNLPMIISAVGFIILAIICYNLASAEIMPTYDDDITASSTQISGAGLLIMYVLIIGAVAAAVVGEVTRIFK